jgi:hypothetical protein
LAVTSFGWHRKNVTVPVGVGCPGPPVPDTVAVSVTDTPASMGPLVGFDKVAVCESTFSHVLLALPLPPAAVFTAVFVVRVIVWPLTGMSEVADTVVVPATAEVIVTVQLAVAAPPV